MKFHIGLMLFLALNPRTFAWSGASHMVIAAEAWSELPLLSKTKVTAILKAHPEYAKWQETFSDESADLDLNAYIFMRASTWPDEIRRHHSQFDHPHWHYINYPLKPPSFPVEPGPSPQDDILYGIAQCEKNLGDPKVVPEERAVYLSWLIHLVGDLHQPLHCSSLTNEKYPVGDKGGNDFYVLPASRGIKLHSLWDGLLGASTKPQSRVNYGIEIRSEHSRKSLKELSLATTPKAWSLEARAVAIEKIYLRGALKSSRSAETASELPDGYTKSAKAVAEKQAALAGYRLADEIKQWVK